MFHTTYRYQFKAKPLNPNIFQREGLYGVPQKRLELPMTEPLTPHLATEDRIQQRKAQEAQDHSEPKHNFHARPVPKEIFEKVKVM